MAELAKLYENVFRNVNIALANELAVMCREFRVKTGRHRLDPLRAGDELAHDRGA